MGSLLLQVTVIIIIVIIITIITGDRNQERKFREWLSKCHSQLDKSLRFMQLADAAVQACTQHACAFVQCSTWQDMWVPLCHHALYPLQLLTRLCVIMHCSRCSFSHAYPQQFDITVDGSASCL